MTSSVLRLAGLPRMRPRDPADPARAASSLELFFDLTFVVGVSVAAEGLVPIEDSGDWVGAVTGYIALFFTLWWGWVNFTWFASAFDTDDWLYRVTTVVQMGGVLVVAGGIHAAYTDDDVRMIVAGYVVMRLPMVAQWLRAAGSVEYRATALRYAAGITAVQVLWVLRLLVPASDTPAQVVTFLLLVGLELLVPVWAERPRTTPSNPRHIAERYGLFTLIVLGEGLLSVTHALIEASDDAEHGGDLVLLGASALVLIAGLWWVYFSREPAGSFTTLRSAFAFGYLHWVVFAAAAALASGLELGLLADTTGSSLPEAAVRAAATVPVALFLLATWLVVLRASLGPVANRTVPVLAVAAGAAALVPGGVQWCALAVAVSVVVLEVDARRAGAADEDRPPLRRARAGPRRS